MRRTDLCEERTFQKEAWHLNSD